MGLLDEAIRQHLELKRQHGASDEEVHMQEQEALGPVRREAVEPAAEEPEDAEPLPEAVHEEDLEPDYGTPHLDAGADAPAYEEVPAEEVAGDARLDAPPLEDALLDESPLEEPPEPLDPYAHAETGGVDTPTEFLPAEEGSDPVTGEDTPSRGFEAVPDPALPTEEGDEDEDDVLEETPEFLQETPEHDRLWFEQKPPRDFDFDE